MDGRSRPASARIAFSFLVILPLLLLPAARAPAQGGGPSRGERLFRGVVRLQNGGPPCLACHGARGIAVLGGGNLGPNLANAFSRYGPQLDTVIAQTPFATMRPLYADHPLTAGEAGDLAAFLTRIAARGPERATARVLVAAGIGLGLVMLFILLIWQNRLPAVRKTLLRKSRPEERRR